MSAQEAVNVKYSLTSGTEDDVESAECQPSQTRESWIFSLKIQMSRNVMSAYSTPPPVGACGAEVGPRGHGLTKIGKQEREDMEEGCQLRND